MTASPEAPRRPAKIRNQIQALEESKISEVWQLGFDRKHLIPLWVGESDFVTPPFIRRAAAKALEEGRTFYSHKNGEPLLREALLAYSNRLYGTPACPKPVALDRIFVTSAGMNGIMMVMECLIDPGDEIVGVTPAWPNIFAASRIMGATAKSVALTLGERGWRLDLDRLFAACTPRTRAMFINSPSNPTGWMMTKSEQRAALEFCRQHGIWLIADEVYARFVYDGRPAAPSFLAIAAPEDDLIVINSFSKPWAMTGWRLGWLTVPARLARELGKVVEFNTSGTAPLPSSAEQTRGSS